METISNGLDDCGVVIRYVYTDKNVSTIETFSSNCVIYIPFVFDFNVNSNNISCQKVQNYLKVNRESKKRKSHIESDILEINNLSDKRVTSNDDVEESRTTEFDLLTIWTLILFLILPKADPLREWTFSDRHFT